MKKWLSPAFLLLIGTVPLMAQKPESTTANPSSQETGPASRIEVRVDLVNVLFTATDKKKRLVLNLTKDDLRVLEDEKQQSIRFFSRESDLALRVGVLIDTSNSIRDRMRFQQEAAVDFLNATLRPGKDLAYVLAFDVEPQLIQDYTDNTERLSKAIRSLQAGGATGLYDAIYQACKEKMLFFPPPEPYLRRVLVLISDGQDNQSERTREEALAMAQRGEVTIFAISTNRSGLEGKGDKVLKYLAQETGGRSFFPFSASDLASNFQEISRELRSQYSLGYISSNQAHDGTFRNITIQPLDKNVQVRAKSGYFAPSQ